jgi:hypothetical protein
MAAGVYLVLSLLSPPSETLVKEEPTLYEVGAIKDPDAVDIDDVIPDQEKGLGGIGSAQER